MKRFTVWYARVPRDMVFFEEEATFSSEMELGKTHRPLTVVEAESPEDVFLKMQGEQWSPNGEARALIYSTGLSHTSMSVGDVMVDSAEGLAYIVAPLGFAERLIRLDVTNPEAERIGPVQIRQPKWLTPIRIMCSNQSPL